RLRPVPPEPAPRTPPLPLFPYTTLFRSNRSSLGGGSTDAPGCGVRTGVFISGNTAPHVAHISAAAKVRNFEAIRDMTHGALATDVPGPNQAYNCDDPSQQPRSTFGRSPRERGKSRAEGPDVPETWYPFP